MTNVAVGVRVDLRGFAEYRKRLTALDSGGGSVSAGDAWSDMKKQWAARYGAFTAARFSAQSRGAGEWPGLSPSTQRSRVLRGRAGKPKLRADGSRGRRRRGSKTAATLVVGRRFSILADTGTLFRSLQGTLERLGDGFHAARIPRGIRFGFSAAPHAPPRRGKGKAVMTIARLAAIHHFGLGNNPVRRLLVQPDAQTIRGFQMDAARAIDKQLRAIPDAPR